MAALFSLYQIQMKEQKKRMGPRINPLQTLPEE
jgi:hypothetical protein